MKTEILDTIKLPEPFVIYGTLALEGDNVVLLKGKHKLGEKPVLQVEILGSDSKLIDVSHLRGLNTDIGSKSLFTYKRGFGIIEHDHAKFHLWENLATTSREVIVEQKSSDNQLNLYENYLEYVSYDAATDIFVIGIGEKHSPDDYAKWFAELTLENKINQGSIFAYWDNPFKLKREDYPKTYFHYKAPTLEWLNINNLIAHKGKKYIICRGGQRTVGKTGVEFEFNVLGVYDNQNRIYKKLELEFGHGRFSSDKQFFIMHPIKKKRLLVYNLETLDLAYNIPLKTLSNMGDIPINYGVVGDLNNNLLYISHFGILNICKASFK